jgi:membrane dipeptidase
MTWESLSADQLARAERICESAIFLNALDATESRNFTPEYIDMLHRGGVDVANVTIAGVEDNFRAAVRSYTNWQKQFRLVGPDRIRIVRQVADIEAAKRESKIAVIMGFQNSEPVEDDLDLANVFHDLGIRIMQLTYNRRNFIGNGCGEDDDSGLSKYGIAYVRRLNECRFTIDLSHAGVKTALDAIEVSQTPPVVTHTNMKALCPHFRCISDAVLKAVADRGGVVGITALSVFLTDDGLEKGSRLDTYLDHLEYAVGLAGIDHVGLGFDVGFLGDSADIVRPTTIYPRGQFPPTHLRYCAELRRADTSRNVVAGMISRGFEDRDIVKILGENFLRVFKTTWQSDPIAHGLEGRGL